jgi:hypothetical protein
VTRESVQATTVPVTREACQCASVGVRGVTCSDEAMPWCDEAMAMPMP